ncbi:hypothetical protein EP331_04110 [bacterium]|nr:MAG: hypothetical protein EP331_04110 [bacterium]
MLKSFSFALLLGFISVTGSAQNHLIRAEIDTLLRLIPAAPDTMIRDNPLFETPNVHPQNTFELTQLYYDKSVPIKVIQFKLQDYSINRDYYQEQAIETFNLDDGEMINRSDSLMGYHTHFFKNDTQTSITMFLGEYLIIELKQEGAGWSIERLEEFLKRFPIDAIKERFLHTAKLYRHTKVVKTNKE